MRTNKHIYGEPSFWLKGEEACMARERRLTVILREKDRSSREVALKQYLPMFEPIPIYYLVDGTGDQAKGIAPDFHPDDGTTVQVVRRRVCRIGDIANADLRYSYRTSTGGSVPGSCMNVTRYFETEMSPGRKFPLETVITVYWVEYLPNEEPATD